MAESEHLRILKQGVKIFNKWRKENPDIKPDLADENLREVIHSSENLTRAKHQEVNVDQLLDNLIRGNISEPSLREPSLRGVDLSEANLSGTNLSGMDLSGADLSGADLSGANLSNMDITGIRKNFCYAYMDLIRANLSEADLSWANLSGANLSETDLKKANLRYVDLSGANLSAADLSESNLKGADLSGANLSGANLSGAHLHGVNLSGAVLDKTNFRNVKVAYTIFGYSDLSSAFGLEVMEHSGPSTIGIDTMFRSIGKIPHKFLKDAGVPDAFIEYMGSLTGQAFQFYSCFISHSTDDKEFADRIYADLRKEGVRCWFASEDIKGGKKIHQQLDEAIRIYDKLLLILSEKSINSDWVANEIRWARKREKQEGRQKLFPVSLIEYEKLKRWELFDADTATDLAAEVRSYFIPDFANWKNHNNYLAAFKRLLRDLQTEK